MSRLLWSGSRDDFAIILNKNFKAPDESDESENLVGFLDVCNVKFKNDGTAELFSSAYSEYRANEIRDELLRHIAMTLDFGRVTRIGLDEFAAHDINIIANGVVHYRWKDVMGFVSPTLTTKELAGLIDFGQICFSLAEIDVMDAAYASFLLMESTSYQYHIWVRNRKLFITGSTIPGHYQLLEQFSSILAHVQYHAPKYKRVTHEDAVAIAFRYGYKSFVSDGDFWVALPEDHEPLELDGVKQDMLNALQCTRDGITGEEIANLSIIELATIVKLGNVCLTRQTILDYKYDFFSRVDFTRFVRTGSVWAIYTSLGYSMPNEITLNVKQDLKFEGNRYYYTADSGLNIVLAEMSKLPDILYEEFNRQFKRGRYFDAQTFTVYLESGKLLSNSPAYTINVTGETLNRVKYVSTDQQNLLQTPQLLQWSQQV